MSSPAGGRNFQIDKLLETGRQQDRLIADLRQQIRRQAETIFRMELRQKELIRIIHDKGESQ